MLRLPSLFAMLAALSVLHRIASELFDEDTAVYAVLIFATHPLIIYHSHNARPYALGLLLTLVAMLYFVRWLKNERLIDGISFAIFSGLAVYAHPFFGELLLSCGAVTVCWLLNGKISNRIHMLTIWGSLFIFLLPALHIYSSLRDRSHSLVYAAAPSFADFFLLLVPKHFIVAFIPCLIVGFILRTKLAPISKKYGRWLLLLACWVFVPTLTLFVITSANK